MAELITESHEEPDEQRNIIGIVLIIGLVVFLITLGVVVALALMGPTLGPGIYSNISGSI
ncbi:MAG: hypothetical protein IT324_20015 [Anaerolineae bacterium]|nr:hypothetical protein [Anaerolineae bacterium]